MGDINHPERASVLQAYSDDGTHLIVETQDHWLEHVWLIHFDWDKLTLAGIGVIAVVDRDAIVRLRVSARQPKKGSAWQLTQEGRDALANDAPPATTEG